VQQTATYCNTLHHLTFIYAGLVEAEWAVNTVAATHCNALQRTAKLCNTLQHTSALQHMTYTCAGLLEAQWAVNVVAATHCNTLQYNAT